MKIKLYTDMNWFPQSYNPDIILSTLWGYKIDEDVNRESPDYNRFTEFKNEITLYFEVSNDINDADLLVSLIEFRPEFYNYFFNLSFKLYSNYKKKLLLFFNNDYDSPLNFEHIIFLRTSFYKNYQSNYEYAIPGWSIDFFKTKFSINKLSKDIIPTISYCGYMSRLNPCSIKNLLKIHNLFKADYKKKGSYYRKKAINLLSKDTRIKTNFLIRESFFGSTNGDKITARNEYINNMISSLYCLVVRGEGNYSYRLYEVMSCGRIPVFINTNCVLPYDWLIPYKKLFVWVEHNEINFIVDKILLFHNNKSSSEILDLQYNIRSIYSNYLSPIGFFSNFIKILDNEKCNKNLSEIS